MGTLDGRPAGVWTASGFFALAGVLEVVLHLYDHAGELTFLPLWDATGRGLLHLLVALGLWQRLAFCRHVALVYCVASLATYLVTLGMALAGAPVRFPASVIAGSAFQIPSCALLLPYLRSPPARQVFNRRLFGS